MSNRLYSLWLLLLALPLSAVLLSACGNAAPQATTPLLTVPEVLAGAQLERSRVVGYVLVDTAGARLVDGIRMKGGAAQAVPAPSEQLWLEGGDLAGLALQGEGEARYAPVVASGRLEGPGSYGPGGAHRFRLRDGALAALAPRETTVAQLLESPQAYADQLVRVNGGLLAGRGQALLVEALTEGGAPAPDARQLKLNGALPDTALPDELSQSPSGGVRYGKVQVEGLWRGGALTPLLILAVTE
ncbi:MAG: hypothetical protein RLZZ387_3377 [Chloroflexota bacterium]|jgi:hypothetical protein